MRPAHVVVIGAGAGGLSAAISLARAGVSVKLLEGRPGPGGLASSFVSNGITFDTGPYILLEPSELHAVFADLGLDLRSEVDLMPVHEIYEVTDSGGEHIRFYSSLERTADELDEKWSGAGKKYEVFVRSMQEIYRDVSPMLSSPGPNPIRFMSSVAGRHVAFLLKTFDEVMSESRLPRRVTDAIGVWTQVAGQNKEDCPSAMAFVQAMIHLTGAYYPRSGMSEITRALARHAQRLGVDIHYNSRVSRIAVKDGAVTGVETADGKFIATEFVLSDCGGLLTYLMLVESGLSRALRTKLNRIPLQSPGVCAYLSVKGVPSSPYIRFRIPGGRAQCRLLVRPSAIEGTVSGDDWQAARLLAPMTHHDAERLGRSGQAEFLASVLAEPWWKESISEHRLLATRTPSGWAHEFGLYRESINPVFNADALKKDRMRHRSPYIKGLYLSGSSTHPGPRVTLCAISGILSARKLLKDMGINHRLIQ